MLNTVIPIEPGDYTQEAEPDVASFPIEETNPQNKNIAWRQLSKLSSGGKMRG